jgi:SAM-dependent methyltransferase
MTGPQKPQIEMEALYGFPLHYIPSLTPSGFTESVVLSWGYEYLSYLRFVLGRLKRLEFNTLLDVGCGDGRLLHEIRRELPGKDLLGVDTSERAIALADIMSPGVKHVCAEVRALGRTHPPVDVVTLIEVLEHIPPADLPGFLEDVSPCVRDGGSLLITTPGKLTRLTPHHFQHFSLDQLRGLLADRFEVVEHAYLNRQSGEVAILQKLLSNRLFVLRSEALAARLYHRYERSYLLGTESDHRRLFLLCRKK